MNNKKYAKDLKEIKLEAEAIQRECASLFYDALMCEMINKQERCQVIIESVEEKLLSLKN